MPMTPADVSKKYEDLTVADKLRVVGVSLFITPLIIWSLLTKPFVAHNASKAWKRVLVDTVMQKSLSRLTPAQMQLVIGTSTLDIYKTWIKRIKQPVVVEEIGEDTRLLWLGPKRTDKVVLFFHGGGYLLPIQYFMIPFWKYVQDEWKAKGQEVGFAILNYTLAQYGRFPTQLKQASRAVEHILASGVSPENLHIAGDSAGGNLVIQVLTHLVRPMDGIPPVKLSAPLKGAYMMSPWVNLQPTIGHPLDKSDTISSKLGNEWGAAILADVPEDIVPYLDPAKTPEGWYEGLDKVVSRVLISCGGDEFAKDNIVGFKEKLAKHHSQTEVIVQPGGVHDDPLNDFVLGDGKNNQLTQSIITWFLTGHSS